MSIIYDALQKTQQNRKALRLTDKRKITWVDILLITIIAILFIMVVVAYYPRVFKHAKKTQPAQVQAQTALKQTSITHLTAQNTKPLAPVVTPIVVKQAPKPKLVSSPVPIIAKSVPTPPKPQVVAPRQPIEQLFAPPKHGSVRSDSTVILPAPPAPIVAPQPVAPTIGMAVPQPAPASNPVLPIADYVGNLMLNGVFETDQEKVALINNQSYHIGDTVGGMKIIAMDLNSVKLRNDKNIFILRVIS